MEWKRIDRLSSPSLQHAADQPDAGGNFSQLTTALKDPLTGQPFPGQHHPGEPDHGRRPRDRERLQPDVAGGGAYTDTS